MTDSNKPQTTVDISRDFRALENMQPGEKWTRLDGQERTVPEKIPAPVEKAVIGRQQETRMDGRIISVPVYNKH